MRAALVVLVVALLTTTIIMKGAPGQTLKCELTKAKHGTITICLPPKHKPHA